MGILGPSGAGKSTLFKILTLLNSRTSGLVNIVGHDLDNMSSAEALSTGLIGIVFQEDVMWSELTVDQNLQYMADFKGMNEPVKSERIAELKALLLLDKHRNTLAKHLSGGNKRKLCCAMSLLVPPKVLLMDEPTNGVDPMARKNLYSVLRSLKDTAILILTHRIDEAEKICDKITIINKGQILDVGTPEELKDKYGKVYLLQVEVSRAYARDIEKINQRITSTLRYLKRVYQHELLAT
jgi:ABC-type multidrug transport system ATPase subunit